MGKKKVRVAVIGICNCASSLVQGVHHYKDTPEDSTVPGLMHVSLAGYHVSDIEFTFGIDINVTKVGKDLSEAIFAYPNNTYKFADVPHLGVPVYRGMTHDGLGKYLSQVLKKAPGPTADIVKILKDTGTDVVINFLPVGSEMATKWYVEQVLEAGAAFVNGIPVFIASSEYWAKRFRDRGLPIIGDDIKSQVGATILHRTLTTLFVDRGVQVDRTYQLNFGGNRLPQHAGTRAAGIQENFQDGRGHQHAALRNCPRQHPRRPQRLRALADRSQMGLHSHGRHDLRRGAAQCGSQAGSVGFPQLGRCDDRRHPLRQVGAGPGFGGAAHWPGFLFHEDAAQAVPR